MSSATDGTAFVIGASRDLSRATAQVLGNEFAQVIFLQAVAPAGCRADGARCDPNGTVLRRDTYGRPLRD
jgi:NAD(P)-dependent dehydrogenase (short-subunit alcohol dehydrogenase family)